MIDNYTYSESDLEEYVTADWLMQGNDNCFIVQN